MEIYMAQTNSIPFNLKAKLNGNRVEQENISVKLLGYEKPLIEGGTDAITLAAWFTLRVPTEVEFWMQRTIESKEY